ncbi:MAG: hypothetical protein JXQ83_07510 [Candidatus Glassbacteria bacterium]|nr:hypothetical protein [Candidatus Glassbacteria bacterium]
MDLYLASRRARRIAAVLLLGLGACNAPRPVPQGPGPLRVHPQNPRYFTDNSGKAVYLTGSHTWANLQDISGPSPKRFDYEAYLDLLEKYNHNFFRLWTWEHTIEASWAPDTTVLKFGPTLIYPRTGPGAALDSLPRFDLSEFNQAHFDRLRSRVAEAGERGFYVMIMLFQGWSIEKKGPAKEDPGAGNPWVGHPCNRANNINGIDGDPNGDGQGEETHMLEVPAVTEMQEAYIRKVVDTVNDLDNVLYEISNESNRNSTAWHYEMIDYLHGYEQGKPKQHPVVMTFQYQGGTNDDLFAGPAEAVSPNPGENEQYRDAPPASDGLKVILNDTDHLWGIGGNAGWVWKSFLRGLNPMFMDPLKQLYYYPYLSGDGGLNPEWEAIRWSMGYTKAFAERMDLAGMTPRGELASSGYCLAKTGAERPEYLVYLPEGGEVSVDLTGSPVPLAVELFDPARGVTTDVWQVHGGTRSSLTAPFAGPAVLYLHGAGQADKE